MLELYGRLPEKSRRLYAGVEALKLPYGGITYIAKLFGCSRDTIHRGIEELNEKQSLTPDRNRKAGGGRQSTIKKHPAINETDKRAYGR